MIYEQGNYFDYETNLENFLLYEYMTWILLYYSAPGDTQTATARDLMIRWNPLSYGGFTPAKSSKLFSIAHLDTSNKHQLAQIAHHNAQILQNMRGINSPVTQYHNPFPIHQIQSSGKHYDGAQHLGSIRSSGKDLLTSSTTRILLPASYIKHTYISPKPDYHSKQPEINKIPQFYTSTAKVQIPYQQVLNKPTANPNYINFNQGHDQLIYRESVAAPQFKPISQSHNFHQFINNHDSKFAEIFNTDNTGSVSYYGPAANLIRHRIPQQAAIQTPLNVLPVKQQTAFNGQWTGSLQNTGGHFVGNHHSYTQDSNNFAPIRNNINQQVYAFSPSPSPSSTAKPLSNNEYFINNNNNNVYKGDYLPPVPSSVLTPFIAQVQIQESNKYSQDNNTRSQDSIVWDDFSKHLVPPPYIHGESTTFKSPVFSQPESTTQNRNLPTVLTTPSSTTSSYEQFKAIEIVNKYMSTPMSPLQDANKYRYQHNPEYHLYNKSAPISVEKQTLSNNIKTPFENSNNNFNGFRNVQPNITVTTYDQPIKVIYEQAPHNYHSQPPPTIRINHPAPSDGNLQFQQPTKVSFDVSAKSSYNQNPTNYQQLPKLQTANFEEAKVNFEEARINYERAKNNFEQPQGNIKQQSDQFTNNNYQQQSPTKPSITDKNQNKINYNQQSVRINSNYPIQGGYDQQSSGINSNQPPESNYKQNGNNIQESSKFPTFLPTPNDIDHNRHSSFFTIEDAISLAPIINITPSSSLSTSPTPSSSPPRSPNPVSPSPHPISSSPRPHFEITTSTLRSSISFPNLAIQKIEHSTMAPMRELRRNKTRRRRPQRIRQNIVQQTLKEENRDSLIDNKQNSYQRPSDPAGKRIPSYRDQMRHRLPQTISTITTATKSSSVSQRNRDSKATSSTTEADLQYPTTITKKKKVVSSFAFSSATPPVNHQNQATATENPTRFYQPDTTFMPVKTQQLLNRPNLSVRKKKPNDYTRTSISYSVSTNPPNTSTSEENETNLIDESNKFSSNYGTATTRNFQPKIPEDDDQITTSFYPNHQNEHQDITIDRPLSRQRTKLPEQTTKYFEPNTVENDIITESKSSTTTELKTETRPSSIKTTTPSNKSTQLKPVGKYEAKSRPRFSVKDYRQRPSETTSTEYPTTTRAAVKYNRRYPTRKRLLPSLRNKPGGEQQKDTDSENAIISSTSKLKEKDFSSSTENIDERTNFSSEKTSTTTASSLARPTRRKVVTSRRIYPSRNITTSSSTTTSTQSPRYKKTYTTSSTSTSSSFSSSSTQTPPVRTRERIQNYRKKVEKVENLVEKEIDESAVLVNKMDLVNITLDSAIQQKDDNNSIKIESAIMKIAKDRSPSSNQASFSSTATTAPIDYDNNRDTLNDFEVSSSDHLERIAELTGAGAGIHTFSTVKDKRGQTLQIRNYFSLSTDDPILPIEAFFPTVNKNTVNNQTPNSQK